jgi:hypothetical protein
MYQHGCSAGPKGGSAGVLFGMHGGLSTGTVLVAFINCLVLSFHNKAGCIAIRVHRWSEGAGRSVAEQALPGSRPPVWHTAHDRHLALLSIHYSCSLLCPVAAPSPILSPQLQQPPGSCYSQAFASARWVGQRPEIMEATQLIFVLQQTEQSILTRLTQEV